jgi:mono/diheme cytochrome c family protein
MRLRNLTAEHGGLRTIFIALTSALLLHTGALLAEERSLTSTESAHALAAALGVQFVEGSTSSLILERDGKQYVVDLATRSIREDDSAVQVASIEPQQTPLTPTGTTQNSGASIFQQQCSSCHGSDGKGQAAGAPDLTDVRARSGIPSQRIVDAITSGRQGGATTMPSFAARLSSADINAVAAFVQTLPGSGGGPNVYEPADDLVYSLPTGRRVARKSLYLNFTHRFVFTPAFSGPGLGNTLFGLDDFSVSSFGLRYGVTDKLSVSVYRSPSLINRPIEFMAAYNVLDEYDGHPFNASFRVSIDGQDNFRKNFTTNFEGIVSRSISDKAQFYVVPTMSLGNRRLVRKTGTLASRPPNLSRIDSFSLGGGLAVNVRPSVALVAEVIPTLYHGDELGIDRPSYAFGIQKRVKGHAFTLGFSNGPGTVVAQRAGTRATFLNDPTADKAKGLVIGFNLMRRLR